MAERKKHHFIPKFYLKLFSNERSGKTIGLYNLSSKKYVKNANLKNQAYENYFYGKDGIVEDSLGNLESRTSKTISSIINDNQIPKQSSEEYEILLVYTLFQATRTKSSANEINDLTNKTLKKILSYDDNLKKYVDEVDFMMNSPASFSLKSVIPAIEHTKDLTCKLVINNSECEFITSDNPAVKYNQFLEKKNHKGGRLGLVVKGLQIFFPISPKHLLVFYDSKVYKIGFKKKSFIELIDKNDVNSLNLLQTMNCEELVFFNENITEHYIKNLAEKRVKSAKNEKGIIDEYSKSRISEEKTSIVLHYYKLDLGIKLNLSFIKETLASKTFRPSGYQVELRNENLRNIRKHITNKRL